MDGELGPGVAGGDPARLPPDLLPPLGAVDERGGRDARALQLVEEAERIELADGVGEQVDADAEGTQLAASNRRRRPRTPTSCRLRAVARPPMPAPMTSATPAGPGRVHRTSCTWMRTVLRSRSPGRDGDQVVQPAQAGRRGRRAGPGSGSSTRPARPAHPAPAGPRRTRMPCGRPGTRPQSLRSPRSAACSGHRSRAPRRPGPSASRRHPRGRCRPSRPVPRTSPRRRPRSGVRRRGRRWAAPEW